MTLEFVLASHNAHKVREFQRIIGERMPQAVVLPYDGPEPVEEGVTFAENAFIKARSAAAHTGRIALADDSAHHAPTWNMASRGDQPSAVRRGSWNRSSGT